MTAAANLTTCLGGGALIVLALFILFILSAFAVSGSISRAEEERQNDHR